MFHVDKGELMKIFAVDMDGTFLNNENNYNVNLFKKLNRKYGDKFHFVVASSNNYDYLKSFFYNQDISYIASNGAVIVSEDEIIHQSFLNEEEVMNIIKLLKHNDIFSFVISARETSFILNQAEQKFINRMHQYYSDLVVIDSIRPSQFYKITIELNQSIHSLSHLIQSINSSCNDSVAVDSGYHCIDVMHKDTNKAFGIKKLLTKFGLTEKDLYVFGDSDNDLEMLKMTKHSYAMANANDRVKAVAKNICLSNEEDGVLLKIEEVLKKEL